MNRPNGNTTREHRPSARIESRNAEAILREQGMESELEKLWPESQDLIYGEETPYKKKLIF